MNDNFKELYETFLDKMTGDKTNPWEPYFAWLPVKLRSGRRVWLKHIYHRIGTKTTTTEKAGDKYYAIVDVTVSCDEYDDDFGILQDLGAEPNNLWLPIAGLTKGQTKK